MKCSQNIYMTKNTKTIIISIILLIIVSILSICCGSIWLPLKDVFTALFGNGTRISNGIVFSVRIPRLFATLLAGSSLAVAGMIIQSVLNNPLAGTNVIGVNSGAGFMVALCLALFPNLANLVPLFAFLGALGAVLLVYSISIKTHASKMTIVLAGVAISSILYAGIDTLTTFFPDILVGTNAFKIGGVGGITLSKLSPQYIIIILGIAVSFAFSRDLDVLKLGGEMAISLGMNIKRMRFILLTLAALLCGTAVSFCGLVSFVGLMVPHMARKFVGDDSKPLMLASAIFGALFLVTCDIISRIIFAPYEIPVGIIVAFTGGPFFLYLLLKRKGGKHND